MMNVPGTWFQMGAGVVTKTAEIITHRTAVPGGWIIRTIVIIPGVSAAIEQTFIPDSSVKVQWKESK